MTTVETIGVLVMHCFNDLPFGNLTKTLNNDFLIMAGNERLSWRLYE